MYDSLFYWSFKCLNSSSSVWLSLTVHSLLCWRPLQLHCSEPEDNTTFAEACNICQWFCVFKILFLHMWYFLWDYLLTNYCPLCTGIIRSFNKRYDFSTWFESHFNVVLGGFHMGGHIFYVHNFVSVTPNDVSKQQ